MNKTETGASPRMVIASLLGGLALTTPLLLGDPRTSPDAGLVEGFAWEEYFEGLIAEDGSNATSSREADLHLVLSDSELARLDSKGLRFDFGTADLLYLANDRDAAQAIALATDDGPNSASVLATENNQGIDSASMAAFAADAATARMGVAAATRPGALQRWWPLTLTQRSATDSPNPSLLSEILDDIVETGERKTTADLSRAEASLGEGADEGHPSSGIHRPTFLSAETTPIGRSGAPRNRLPDVVDFLPPAVVAALDHDVSWKPDSLPPELFGSTEPVVLASRELPSGAGPHVAAAGDAPAVSLETPLVLASLAPRELVSPTAIPEPKSIALLGIGIALLGFISRRGRR